MTRLISELGWPTLILCAVLLVAAVPSVVRWVRFELRLSRRASQIAPHKEREGWPYW